ncbi:AGAP010655-PA-like protein [Anopheles sinensis]|uniref:AGAP010655-PA-like protein n=1 Tax=Anopheles sinensis TaxID=74873 RepID=A0A084W8G0_ANOSI|nr:AGAP010655-PA-like protein [Anopheles sinensis]
MIRTKNINRLSGPSGPGLNKASTSRVSVGSVGTSKSSSSYGSRTEPSVRFRLEDEILGSGGSGELSEESASVSIADSLSANDNQHDDDSLEIMEEILVPADGDDDDNSNEPTEEGASVSVQSVDEEGPALGRRSSRQLRQRLSSAGSSSTEEGSSVNRSQPRRKPVASAVTDRKRQLFDIGDDEDLVARGGGGSGASLFDIDHIQLSGDEIAQHFQPTTATIEGSEEDDSFRGGAKGGPQWSFRTLDDDQEEVEDEGEDSFEQPLNESESVDEVSKDKSLPKGVKLVPHQTKELSPLNEDDVLINDSKVNLNSLKRRTQRRGVVEGKSNPINMAESNNNSQDNSLNTTNDISDLAKDTESERVGSVELDPESSGAVVSKPAKLTLEGRSRSVPDERPSPVAKVGFASLGPIRLTEEEKKQQVTEDNHSSASSGGSGVSEDLRERILTTSKSFEEVKAQTVPIDVLEDKIDSEKTLQRNATESVVKQMERVSGEQKEALEDISEESEHTLGGGPTDDERGEKDVKVIEKGKEMRTILEEKLLQKRLSVGSTIYEDNKENVPEGGEGSLKAHDFDSVVSLKMFQTMENEIRKLHEIIATKDVLLETYGRKDSTVTSKDGGSRAGGDSLREQQVCRSHNSDSISVTTNSTEYRPVPGELEAMTAAATERDLHGKIMERNQWIELLAEKLKESLEERNQLQSEGEKLAGEVMQLKKQLAETVESMKLKTQWAGVVRQDQESTSGQRISEISIDLVSETEDGGLSDFPDLYDDQRERERAFDLNSQSSGGDLAALNPLHIPLKISKQLEQFRRYLSQEELRLFNMIQTKFDDFLTQEVEKVRADTQGETENRLLREQLALERAEKEQEVNRLRQMLGSVKTGSIEIGVLRAELEARHTQEMADLRTYFEKKCVELEKQYSEEVFSQQSRRLSNDDTGSEISGAEEFPEENGGYQSKHTSPRRKHKEDIYLSPTHRKITPTTIDATDGSADEVLVIEIPDDKQRHLSAEEVREFYQSKIKEINLQHEQVFANLREKLSVYEAREKEKQFVPVDRRRTDSPSAVVAAELGSESDLQEIIAGYERRLQEQVALARQDVLKELEVQIQALLTDASFEDSHWPPELVLLREKFTAKSQLEVAQLQLKHEEEMARMKNDFEKQLQRKLKRHTTFDSSRGLDKIISERDNLRELSSTLRNVLGGLAKYFSICEDDLNSTVLEELQRCQQQWQANASILAATSDVSADESQLAGGEGTAIAETEQNVTDLSFLSSCKLLKYAPDVSGIISIIEDPSLVEYVTARGHREGEEPENVSINLEECLERLKAEALSLLALSERIKQSAPGVPGGPTVEVSEKNDSCEEEDGLKRTGNKPKPIGTARSFDETMVRSGAQSDDRGEQQGACALANGSRSLPVDLSGLQVNGELNLQLHELRNRLLKSEDDRKQLEAELVEARSKQNSLVSELSETKQHLLELNSQRVEFSEGYGTNALLPTAQRVANNSFVELQERAKALLGSTGAEQTIEDNSMLLQLVEDFAREGERYLEDGKRDRMDLQSQIEAADKQLKATRQFLEDQAAEREQERDEFVKEIDRLKCTLREKEKDKVNFERASKELETVELQVKDLTAQIADRDDRIRKMETDLKDSIDKGFTLREIISELETQIESKTINEHVLETKVKELERYIDVQNQQNESLHQEMESFKTDLAVRGYDDKIARLEEELRQRQPTAEQSIVLEALTVQLRDIEETLERKTKNLETLHSTSGASLGCSSPSEDISVNQDSPLHRKRRAASSGAGVEGSAGENAESKPSVTPLPVDEVQRIFDKLHRHSRVEDVAIKRINDLEMQITNIRSGYAELQHERDVLQEKMSEQSIKISSLQTRLDEQRLRAEELHRQGTSQLTVKVHDLQNELHNLKETLQTRDKQIVNLKQFLENSQQAIARQEKELAMNQGGAERSGGEQEQQRLEAELRAKEEEIRQLRDRIKNEMINKAALPDLMETMLAEKNEEIDQLKDRLAQYQQVAEPKAGMQQFQAGPAAKDDDGGRTLSDVVSITDCDESDMVMRRMPEQGITLEGGILPAHSIPMDSGTSLLPNHSKQSSLQMHMLGAGQGLSGGHESSSMLNSIPLRSNFFHDVCSAVPRVPDQTRSSAPTPEYVPRQINFSLAEDAGSPMHRKSAPVPPSTLMFFAGSSPAPTGEGPARMLVREPAFIEEIVDDEVDTVGPVPAKDDAKARLESEVESLKLNLDRVVNEKNELVERLKGELQEKVEQIADLQVELAARNKLYEDLMQERKELRTEVEKVKQELGQLEQQAHSVQQKESELREALECLHRKEAEVLEVNERYDKLRAEMENVTKESAVLRAEQQRQKLEVDTLRQQVESLNKTIGHKDELMSKLEKDLLNYSKNEEKYLEQLRSLDAKETELKIVQGNYKDRLHEIEILNEDNRFLTEDINRLRNEIARNSNSQLNSNSSYVQTLKQNCAKLEEELQETKHLLTEKMLALERVRIDLSGCQHELEDVRGALREKEMIIQQIGDDGQSLHEALSNIQEQMQDKNVTLNGKLREEQARNAKLQSELEQLKAQLQQSDNSSSPKPFSVEEIAEQLEKELNYSAQLDSSILKAIESDEVNSDDEPKGDARKAGSQRKPSELDDLRQKLQLEMDKGKKMQELLEGEKQNSASIQQQDAEIIEAMRIRLEASLGNESTLQRLLEEERTKAERLSRMVGGLQRTKSFDNYLLLKGKGSPQAHQAEGGGGALSGGNSPQRLNRLLNRSGDFEAEMVARYESELKFLTAQNARERERTADLQRVLERERERFEREITERTEHGEQLKKELTRVLKEKETLELELDHEQEKLELAHRELESLEKRIGALQEAEALRTARRERTSGQNSLEYQELKLRLEGVEFERNQLRDTVQSLRTEVDRRRTREAQLTEALSRENSLHAQGQHEVVPEEFLNKLKDLNRMLESNARENHQQAETLRFMMEERRALQQRIQELERYNAHGASHHKREDLEERANHLFGKYLRSESHRKALVHQKRYLQIVLTTYEENEAKALALLNAQLPPGQLEVLALASGPRSLSESSSHHRRAGRKSFRSVVTVIVAIERMKYLVRKWHGGRRVCAKAIFSQPFSSPRRSQSASTNVWARSPNSHFAEYGTVGGVGASVRMERAEPIPSQLFSASAAGVAAERGAFVRTLSVPVAGSPTSLRMNVDVLETLREHQPQYNRNGHGNR